MLELESVSLVYRTGGTDFYAVRDVSFSVPRGTFLGLMGPSGSGKSSLLYLLSGMKAPSAGAVRFLGHQLHSMAPSRRAEVRRQHFGFVFQQHFLIHYLTVLENVLVGCVRADADNRRRAVDLLERVGLAGHLHKKPPELSGGQRQRVAVVRAVVGRPDVIFADEPTAALDHKTGLHLIGELEAYRRDGGTLVVVTHDPMVLEGADRIIRIMDGELIDGGTAYFA
ncbi:MAG TPA: ABC transporter ATP-binding protein [Symbiobacteriaceae bacterium]|nr:ABC transporter ATP-binding protein [Symbiobacteriaceae bacterium]